jgi:hypothetical protein
MSGADPRDLEKRLLKMQEDIGPALSDEQRADYIALWLDWCEAKGLPRTERTRARLPIPRLRKPLAPRACNER